jgi:hypothetical protein
MANFSNNLVIGSGKLYFDQFLPGTTTPTGERYLGNTPALTVAQSVDSVDHYDSDNGAKVKDDTVDISREMTGGFTTDNISSPNIALWFTGQEIQVAAGVATAVVQSFVSVLPGTFLQVGVVPGSLPQGRGGLTAVSVKVGATTMVLNTDYELDAATGRIYVIPGGAIVGGSTVDVTYSAPAATVPVIVSKNASIYGRLRYIANNTRGQNRNHFWPKIKVSSDGEYALKGDDWQSMDFTYEALKLDSVTERVYIG